MSQIESATSIYHIRDLNGQIYNLNIERIYEWFNDHDTGRRLLTSPKISGTIGHYNGVDTVGSGMPSIVAQANLIGQTASIAATTLFTPAASATYRFSGYVVVTTSGGNGSVDVEFNWTDDAQTQRSKIFPVDSASTDFASFSIYIRSTATAIQYLVNRGGTPTYALFLRLEAL